MTVQTLSRAETERRLRGDDQPVLIETLPAKQFREFHLPGAVNIPVDADDFDEQVREAVPNESTPVIVYCFDKACDASPRAAKRLDELGYRNVFDYEAGKQDWRQAGNPVESWA